MESSDRFDMAYVSLEREREEGRRKPRGTQLLPLILNNFLIYFETMNVTNKGNHAEESFFFEQRIDNKDQP